MPDTKQAPELTALIQKLDEAVSRADTQDICRGVKSALVDAIRPGRKFLEDRFTLPASDKYARRLLHKDPRERYSVVVMVWGPGQGTPLHDHAGKWCVEGVYRGRIRVRSYESEGRDGEHYRFKPAGEVVAGKSEAGHLIPPYEYHTITNADSSASVTIHVYCDEMKTYNAFVPEGGAYRAETRTTYYTD